MRAVVKSGEFQAYIAHKPNTLKKVDQLTIAAKAAAFLSRPPIISILSGLPLAKSREIYRDVTGADPIKGQLPSDTTFYISDVNCHLESVWLAQTYRLLFHEDDPQEIQCECMFKAYSLYVQSFKRTAVSFDRFFLLVRHTFYGNEITISNCPKCNGAKLSVRSWDPNRIVKCPICHLSAAN